MSIFPGVTAIVLCGGAVPQLFPVPVHQQQHVVAGRAGDQHDHDVRGQRGYRQARVSQAGRGGLRDDDRRDRAGQRQQPQDGRPVDQQQDDRHDDQRYEQQYGLLVAGPGVGVHGRRAGHGVS
jgi:hypothetical protein